MDEGRVTKCLAGSSSCTYVSTAACDQPAGKQQASREGAVDRMAVFRAYAKVLEPGDPEMRIYEAGLRAGPGQPGL